MDCGCDNSPYCVHPEEKFVRYVLELRAQGLRPSAIVDVMGDDYMVYAYEGDVLSFLDNSVRTLEAMEELARVDGDEDARKAAKREKETLSG